MKHATFILAMLLALYAPSAAQPLAEGRKAAAFKVYYGDEAAMDSSSLAGRVLVVTYETKNAIEKNRPFKNAVLAWCASSDNKGKAVVPVPVVNCFKYSWPVADICTGRVHDHSKKEGLQLYVDRDGKMFNAYGMQDSESNVVIIDKKGFIRFQRSGKIPDAEIPRALQLIRELAGEPAAP